MQFTPIAVDQTTAITDLLLALVVFSFMVQLRRVKTPRQWKLSMWIWTFAILVTPRCSCCDFSTLKTYILRRCLSCANSSSSSPCWLPLWALC